MSWRLELADLIERAIEIAATLRHDPAKPEPNLAQLDITLSALSKLRQAVIDCHVPPPNGATTLGTTRGVLDFIDDDHSPLIPACGAIETFYLTPLLDPPLADFTSITLNEDGSPSPPIPDGQALVIVEDGKIIDIGIWRQGKPFHQLDVPVNDHGIGKEAYALLASQSPQKLASKTRLYLTCPAALTEQMVWPSDARPFHPKPLSEQEVVARAAFEAFWTKHYPQTPPISYLFKHCLKDRWARVHSLPDTKRYAQTKDEWHELERRHNEVIDHLIPQGTQIRVVTNHIDADNYIFKAFAPVIDLGLFSAGDEEEPSFQCHELTTTWESHSLNPLLIMMAEDQMRAFIIGPDCLIAPYDGGIDVILPNPHACWAFKRKFANWLSKRDDGL